MLTIDTIQADLGTLARSLTVTKPTGYSTIRVTFAGIASSRNDERRALVDARQALETKGHVVADCQAFLIVQK